MMPTSAKASTPWCSCNPPDVPEWRRLIWLDQILRVEHLDSGVAGEG